VGTTQSSGYPTYAAYQSTLSGASDAVLTKVTADGSAAVFSTFLGAGGDEAAYGVGLDNNGLITATGSTTSTTRFPNAGSPFQAGYGGGTSDGWVARFTGTGTLDYSGYFGGTATDVGRAVSVDALGAADIAGYTNSSSGFPLKNPYQSTLGGATGTMQYSTYDGWVARILPGLAPPVITGVSTDSGSSSSDRITNDQTLVLSGTAWPGATVTLDRVGAGT